MVYFNHYVVFALSVIGCIYAQQMDSEQLRIAVIGGGIGGTSLSHFLKKSIPEASVHLYEKGEVGGRLKTIDIAGRNYECGGSIIHPKNLLMKNLVEEMGLSPTDGKYLLIIYNLQKYLHR